MESVFCLKCKNPHSRPRTVNNICFKCIQQDVFSFLDDLISKDLSMNEVWKNVHEAKLETTEALRILNQAGRIDLMDPVQGISVLMEIGPHLRKACEAVCRADEVLFSRIQGDSL